MFKKTTWDTVTEGNILTLHPVLRPKATFFINYWEAQEVYIRIYCGFRSEEWQNDLYAQGRTKPGKVVTQAKAWQSYHNYGLAFDCVEIRKGQALWINPRWPDIAESGKTFGLEWGGNFIKKDKPHFQLTYGIHHTKMHQMVLDGKIKDGFINIDTYLV